MPDDRQVAGTGATIGRGGPWLTTLAVLSGAASLRGVEWALLPGDGGRKSAYCGKFILLDPQTPPCMEAVEHLHLTLGRRQSRSCGGRPWPSPTWPNLHIPCPSLNGCLACRSYGKALNFRNPLLGLAKVRWGGDIIPIVFFWHIISDRGRYYHFVHISMTMCSRRQAIAIVHPSIPVHIHLFIYSFLLFIFLVSSMAGAPAQFL